MRYLTLDCACSAQLQLLSFCGFPLFRCLSLPTNRFVMLQGRLVVGAAVTIAELVASLTFHAAKLPAGQPFASLAAMLARVAGAQVRQAATVGGNLVLAKTKGLESDVATALLGWGATGTRELLLASQSLLPCPVKAADMPRAELGILWCIRGPAWSLY